MKKMEAGDNYTENEFIRLDILNNGSLKITDKKTGKVYSELLNLVDDGEIGDGWYHVNPVNDIAVTSVGGNCVIEKIEHGPSRCVFRIIRDMSLPESIKNDKTGIRRSEERRNMKIITTVGLSIESRYIDVKLEYDNIVKDHRMRMMLPTGIDSDSYFAGQAFYCCERKVGIDFNTQNWHETDQYEKSTNGIFGKRDCDGNGIAFISGEGLHECAAFDDEDGTLSVTLSRSVRNTVQTNGETKCQLNKKLSYSFVISPLDTDVKYSDLIKIQDEYAVRPLSTFTKVKSGTKISEPVTRICSEGENIAVSIIKKPESDEDTAIVIRVFNASENNTNGVISLCNKILKAEKVNLNEEKEYEIPVNNGKLEYELMPWKIATFKIYFQV